MRDKYNLNTLPAGVEEDFGNLGDMTVKKQGKIACWYIF